MNTELLLKVKAAILAEPLKFDMDTWFDESEDSPCKTTACIAGHALAIEEKRETLKPGLEYAYSSKAGDIGQELLALDEDQRAVLFSIGGWPDKFQCAYARARNSKQRAKSAADRIDHFIATEGRE